MKNLFQSLSLGVTIVLISACATENHQIDKKMANETQIENRKDLQVEADFLIQNSTTLSDVQKTSLLELRKSTKNQMDELESESLKLRAVLLKAVLNDKFDRKEVDAIKGRMKKVENQKLTRIFDTVERANKIIGRNRLGPQDPVFSEFFIFDTMRTIH